MVPDSKLRPAKEWPWWKLQFLAEVSDSDRCIVMHCDALWCIMMHYDALWCIMMHWVSNTERSVLIVCYRCYSKIQWRPRNPDRFVVDTSWYSILLNVCMFFFSRSRKGAGDAEHGFELRAPSCLGDLGQKQALRPLRDGEQVKP